MPKRVLTKDMSIRKAIETYRREAQACIEKAEEYEKKARTLEQDSDQEVQIDESWLFDV